MLNSLVRVSRRVGWVTDLLAANRRTLLRGLCCQRSRRVAGPRSRSVRPAGRHAPATLLHPQPIKEETSKPKEASFLPRSGREPCDETANNRRQERVPPPANCVVSPLRPRPNRLRRPSGRKQMRRSESNRNARTAPSREPSFSYPDVRLIFPTECSCHRISRAHPFTSEQFHVLLNSLFKVLCNFPSRYLFAIGLVIIFSLRCGIPPT